MRLQNVGRIGLLLVVGALSQPIVAKPIEYTLTIDRLLVRTAGAPIEKLAINGNIPGPTLHFTKGDEAVIHVTNKMDVPTSVHWHGLIVPGEMDGIPTFNGFLGIMPGETFTYRFPVQQTGTYWYHAHSSAQEQDGLYGPLILAPKETDSIKADRDYVVLLSDYKEENGDQIMNNLKPHGMDKAGKEEARDSSRMHMAHPDLADVSGYLFLVNGQSPQQNWTGLFTPGERVRLRFINASAMSFFDVRIPGLKLNVVQADGQNVEPVMVDEFRVAPGETYDVIVTPKDSKAYTIAAESIDRSGFAIGTLATMAGQRGEMPMPRPLPGVHPHMTDMEMKPTDHGWEDAAAPEGQKALSYADLRYAGVPKEGRPPEHTIDVRLKGNMDPYVWTIDGKGFSNAAPLHLRYGERVRLKFTNETMMAHPMHLHGMFVQLENGQPAEKLPYKHTILVPAGGSYSVLVTADARGEWALHCHMLYHMMAGMMMKVVVAERNPLDIPLVGHPVSMAPNGDSLMHGTSP